MVMFIFLAAAPLATGQQNPALSKGGLIVGDSLTLP